MWRQVVALLVCVNMCGGHVSYIGCSMVSTYSGNADLTTTGSIMGSSVSTSMGLVSADSSTYADSGTVTLTFTSSFQ